MKKYTKAAAKETIEAYSKMTGYFDESISQNDMYEMLRCRMAFGDAEARVIVAALTISGAKWRI